MITRSSVQELDSTSPRVVGTDSTASAATTARRRADVALPVPDEKGRWSNGFDWVSIFWIGLIHVGAVAAMFFFTWKAVLLFVVLSWLTGSVGVCLGYHRLLTHRSFQTSRPVRWALAVFGTLAGEGPPITWVAVHRKHHHFSDKEGDPHSPHDGAWWSHMLWLFPRPQHPEWDEMLQRYAKDLLKDPVIRLIDKTFLAWHFALGLSLFAFGWYFWGTYTGLSFVFYGMFLRLVYVMHVTWLVNSASHMWGYRNYETRDDSRNLWWVGLLAYGEGWHNNHHAYPTSARHGHRWWEIDVTYMLLRAMESCGLAWDVIRAPSASVDEE